MTSPSLSMMERRVGALVAAEQADREIARRLLVSIQSVEWSVAKLCSAFGVVSRSELRAALIGLRSEGRDSLASLKQVTRPDGDSSGSRKNAWRRTT